MLDGYRWAFEPAYRQAIEAVQAEVGLSPTGRPGKSTGAIVAKLRRETIRLSQIQDIAGCRVVVPTLKDQDRIAPLLSARLAALGLVKKQDRRHRPSHGYRAIHLIVRINGKPVEIQIRTTLQHLWAEISEILADVHGNEVKYGGEVQGQPGIREALDTFSELIAAIEGRQAKALEEKLGEAELNRRLTVLVTLVMAAVTLRKEMK